MRIKTVLFDAAGTLFVLDPLLGTVVANALSEAGTPRQLDRIRAALRAVATRTGWPQDQADDTSRRGMWQSYLTEVLTELDVPQGEVPGVVADYALRPDSYRCYPDVREHLSLLRQSGTTLAVVSNFDDFLFPILQHLELEDSFDAVITSFRTGWMKPDSRIFKHALTVTASATSETIMLGDSLEADVRGANELGVRAVLIDRHGLYPGYRGGPVAHSFDEVSAVAPGYPV